MAIKGLDCYTRRMLIGNERFVFESSKGRIMILQGMIFGLRLSHNKRTYRLILNDEINKVYTLCEDDFNWLIENSVII